MNGKRAKHLRKLAPKYLEALGHNPNDGLKSYTQAMNCKSMERVYDEDGKPLRDPDGVYLLTPKKAPGTIRHEHKEQIVYNELKKRVKESKYYEPIINY